MCSCYPENEVDCEFNVDTCPYILRSPLHKAEQVIRQRREPHVKDGSTESQPRLVASDVTDSARLFTVAGERTV